MVVAFNKNEFLGVAYDNKKGTRVKLHDELISLRKEVEEAYKNGEIKESDYKKIVKEIDETIKLLYKPGTTVVQVHDRIIKLSKLIEEATEGKVVPIKTEKYKGELTKKQKRLFNETYEMLVMFMFNPGEKEEKLLNTKLSEIEKNGWIKQFESWLSERMGYLYNGKYDEAFAGIDYRWKEFYKDEFEKHKPLYQKILKKYFKDGRFDYSALKSDFISARNTFYDYIDQTKTAGTAPGAWNIEAQEMFLKGLNGEKGEGGAYEMGRKLGKNREIASLLVIRIYGLSLNDINAMLETKKAKDEIEGISQVYLETLKSPDFLKRKREFISTYGPRAKDLLSRMDLLAQHAFLMYSLPAIEAASTAMVEWNEEKGVYVVVPPETARELIFTQIENVIGEAGYAGSYIYLSNVLPRLLDYYKQENALTQINATIVATARSIHSNYYWPENAKVMKEYFGTTVPKALDRSQLDYVERMIDDLLKNPALASAFSEYMGENKFALISALEKNQKLVEQRLRMTTVAPYMINIPQDVRQIRTSFFTLDDVTNYRNEQASGRVSDIYYTLFSPYSVRMIPRKEYHPPHIPIPGYDRLLAYLSHVEAEKRTLPVRFLSYGLTGTAEAEGEKFAAEKWETDMVNVSVTAFGVGASSLTGRYEYKKATKEKVKEGGERELLTGTEWMTETILKDVGTDWTPYIESGRLMYGKGEYEGNGGKIEDEKLLADLNTYWEATGADVLLFFERGEERTILPSTHETLSTNYFGKGYMRLKNGDWIRVMFTREELLEKTGEEVITDQVLNKLFGSYLGANADIRTLWEKNGKLTEREGYVLDGMVVGLNLEKLGIVGIYDKSGDIKTANAVGAIFDALDPVRGGGLSKGVIYIQTFWGDIKEGEYKGLGAGAEMPIGSGWFFGKLAAGKQFEKENSVILQWHSRDVAVDAAWLQMIKNAKEEETVVGRGATAGVKFDFDRYGWFLVGSHLKDIIGVDGVITALAFKDEKGKEAGRIQMSYYYSDYEYEEFGIRSINTRIAALIAERMQLEEEIEELSKTTARAKKSEDDIEVAKKMKRITEIDEEIQFLQNRLNLLYEIRAGRVLTTLQTLVRTSIADRSFEGGLEVAIGDSPLGGVLNQYVVIDESFGAAINVIKPGEGLQGIKSVGGKIVFGLPELRLAMQGGSTWMTDYNGQTVLGGIMTDPRKASGVAGVGGYYQERKNVNLNEDMLNMNRFGWQGGIYFWTGDALTGRKWEARKEMYFVVSHEHGYNVLRQVSAEEGERILSEQSRITQPELGLAVIRIDENGQVDVWDFALLGMFEEKQFEETKIKGHGGGIRVKRRRPGLTWDVYGGMLEMEEVRGAKYMKFKIGGSINYYVKVGGG
ncbi:MAG: hypothetical protein QXY05_04120 [Candidatus Anstonellales archaeon]